MRGLLPFLAHPPLRARIALSLPRPGAFCRLPRPSPAHRLFRALIALWLVSTVVFVVMRLSGDPVPLLLPPDAPTSEIMRVRRELGLDTPLPVPHLIFPS